MVQNKHDIMIENVWLITILEEMDFSCVCTGMKDSNLIQKVRFRIDQVIVPEKQLFG